MIIRPEEMEMDRQECCREAVRLSLEKEKLTQELLETQQAFRRELASYTIIEEQASRQADRNTVKAGQMVKYLLEYAEKGADISDPAGAAVLLVFFRFLDQNSAVTGIDLPRGMRTEALSMRLPDLVRPEELTETIEEAGRQAGFTAEKGLFDEIAAFCTESGQEALWGNLFSLAGDCGFSDEKGRRQAVEMLDAAAGAAGARYRHREAALFCRGIMLAFMERAGDRPEDMSAGDIKDEEDRAEEAVVRLREQLRQLEKRLQAAGGALDRMLDRVLDGRE